jgi:aconitate hydratase
MLQSLKNTPNALKYVAIDHYDNLATLPYCLRILLENLERQKIVRGFETHKQIEQLLKREIGAALNFYPTRIFGQDILAKVMMVDMAALRGSLAKHGINPSSINPAVPVDIIIDHSLQVDVFGVSDAVQRNLEIEYSRNGERFAFLRWCAESFEKLRVVPSGKGIMHQIHIENIAQVVWEENGLLSPDTCIGTDSHTPMVNGIGVLGWGVGGIEAEAVMLGKPISFRLPRVIGVELTGQMREGVMPTDLVLHITQALRKADVVGEFVEFFGESYGALNVADRATIANMAPEYGATAVYFPIDQRTIDYLQMTGRPQTQLDLIEKYAKAQRLWCAETPVYDAVVHLDLSQVSPSIAGPKNPEDRHDLSNVKTAFTTHMQDLAGRDPSCVSPVEGKDYALHDGSVVIAAITSCTNTSNPFGMIAAGLVARKANALGLKTKPWVKTSLSPGSHVVGAVLENTGLQADLDALGFHLVGYGCATCNGSSGPLKAEIANAIEAQNLLATAVLSGNRNFQGRIHPHVKAAYLASPALVVAYALAGSMTLDITREPLAQGVYLKDIWPTNDEINALVREVYRPEIFVEKYQDLFEGGDLWENLQFTPSPLFEWQENSTYVREPPFFEGLTLALPATQNITHARALCILGDSITTDDISPSGAISLGTPSADFLLALGVQQKDFNNYTTRRSNHEVAVRATFANIRLKNKMLNGVEGGFTALQPEGTQMRIFEAAQVYSKRKTPLVVIAGKDYGAGSSRDWAAKGVALLGVKAIIATGFERIHRTNLVGMGVLPLQFKAGVNAETLQLNGTELFTITGLDKAFNVRDEAILEITYQNGATKAIPLTIRLDTPEDINYWRNGGILPTVWRERIKKT